VIATSALETGLASITQLPPGCQPAPLDLIPTFADEKISAAIDVSGHREAKVAALRAHATQLTVSDDGSSMALSNLIALPIADIEHFVLVRGEPGVDTGWDSDLFAGVEL
ncbi:N-acetyl-1-D-myo-inositol-2-amino-2-deoxy-alpha-D-glucopyranoside deacetylase, partial [Staphylococcus capitis]|nr:N-acetyl-1-D-myo-inositol-2-amino-2-deoxy-alpha-D-glucopyranoside deacetylase [Staphylococcus capitis]